MGITVATTRVAASTGGGDQDITTSKLGGLTPKAVRFVWSQAITDDTAADHALLGMGFSDGTNDYCVGGSAQNGVDTSYNTNVLSTSNCIDMCTPGSTAADGQASVSTFITNGVTINWGDAPATAKFLHVTFFAGTDLSVHTNTHSIGIEVPPATINVTDVGFESDLVLSIVVARTAPGRTNGSMAWASGYVHNDGVGGVTQRTAGVYWVNNEDTMLMFTELDSDAGIALTTSSQAGGWRCSFVNFDSSGFDMTFTGAIGGHRDICYLCLNFGGAAESWVGDFITPTTAISKAITDPGFTPQFVEMGLGRWSSGDDHNSQNVDAGSFGFSSFDDTDEYAVSFCSEDDADIMNTQSLSDDAAVEFPLDDGTADYTATGPSGSGSFDANGWTLSFTAVNGTAHYFPAFAIEAPAAADAIIEDQLRTLLVRPQFPVRELSL